MDHVITGDGRVASYHFVSGPEAEELASLITQANGTLDDAARNELYQKAVDLHAAQALTIPLYYENLIVMLDKDLQAGEHDVVNYFTKYYTWSWAS